MKEERVPAPYTRLIHAVNETDKWNPNGPTWLTIDEYRNRPMTDGKLYTSLAANTIKAKLTNHF